jgi:hypothetical protein
MSSHAYPVQPAVTSADRDALLNTLWLNPIEDESRDRSVSALRNGDVLGFLVHASNGSWINLVSRNHVVLLILGLYEQALLQAFTSTTNNHNMVPQSVLRYLFQVADRQRLRDASQPLPGCGPFTVYRGVAGQGTQRRVRGFSWTASLELAWRFAKRYPWIHNPAVHKAVVEEAQVLAYWNRRQEQEFIVMADNLELVRVDERGEPFRRRDRNTRLVAGGRRSGVSP